MLIYKVIYGSVQGITKSKVGAGWVGCRVGQGVWGCIDCSGKKERGLGGEGIELVSLQTMFFGIEKSEFV